MNHRIYKLNNIMELSICSIKDLIIKAMSALSLTIIGILLINGCYSDSSTPKPGSPITVAIGPAGGTINYTTSDGIQATLTIPAGALSGAVDIGVSTISAQETQSRYGAYNPVGPFISLTPNGTQFARPVSLTFTYPVGFDVTDLIIMKFSETDSSAIPMQLPTEVSGQVVTLDPGHFCNVA